MPTPIKSVYWARVLETRIVSCSWSICRGNVVNSLSLAISERHTSRAFHTRVLNPPESIAVSQLSSACAATRMKIFTPYRFSQQVSFVVNNKFRTKIFAFFVQVLVPLLSLCVVGVFYYIIIVVCLLFFCDLQEHSTALLSFSECYCMLFQREKASRPLSFYFAAVSLLLIKKNFKTTTSTTFYFVICIFCLYPSL